MSKIQLEQNTLAAIKALKVSNAMKAFLGDGLIGDRTDFGYENMEDWPSFVADNPKIFTEENGFLGKARSSMKQISSGYKRMKSQVVRWEDMTINAAGKVVKQLEKISIHVGEISGVKIGYANNANGKEMPFLVQFDLLSDTLAGTIVAPISKVSFPDYSSAEIEQKKKAAEKKAAEAAKAAKENSTKKQQNAAKASSSAKVESPASSIPVDTSNEDDTGYVQMYIEIYGYDFPVIEKFIPIVPGFVTVTIDLNEMRKEVKAGAEPDVEKVSVHQSKIYFIH